MWQMVLFESLTFKEEDQKNSGGVWGGGFKSSRLTDTPGDPQICPSSLRSAQRTITSPAQTYAGLKHSLEIRTPLWFGL